MIDDVMSAPPFTLFPSSFLHRSFLLLSPVREVVILHELNIAPEAHNPRASLSRLPLPLLVLCFLLPPSPLPSLISPSFSVTRKRPTPSTLSRTISIRYLSVIPALLGSSVPFGASPTTARKTRFLRDPRNRKMSR